MISLTHRSIAGTALLACLAVAGLSSTARAQLDITGNSFSIFNDGYSYVSGSGETFGIFELTKVTDSTGVVFNQGASTTQYFGIFYGSHDVAPPAGSDFAASGLQFDIYQLTGIANGVTAFNTVAQQGTGGRAGTDGYTGISDVGSLMLHGTLNGLLVGNINSGTGVVNSSGNIMVSADNDMLFLPANNIVIPFGITSQAPKPPVSDWDYQMSSNLTATFTPVPEPATYGVFGVLGLFGLIAFRRLRRRNALPVLEAAA
jgi:hypothetical protein